MIFKSKLKYNNRRVGKFDSQAEEAYSQVLDLMVKDGVIRGYIHHPEPVILSKSVKWRIDFFVMPTDNKADGYFVEIKGVEDPVFKIKLRLYADKKEELPKLFVLKRKTGFSFDEIASIDPINGLRRKKKAKKLKNNAQAARWQVNAGKKV